MKEGLKVAKSRDGFLKYLLENSDRGKVRLGNASEHLKISDKEMREVYFYLTITWNPDYIQNNQDAEVWLNTKYEANVREFLHNGGFVQKWKTERYIIRNTKWAMIISVIAIIISFIALFKPAVIKLLNVFGLELNE